MGAGAVMPMMMMADSLNQRLDSLIVRMNQAKGDKKVDAMAAVINELVAQRKIMMSRMHEQMMDGMMRMHGMDGAPSPAPNPGGHADSAADTSGHDAHHPPR
jgi:hypothetical protein